jgi:hypothetical protein
MRSKSFKYVTYSARKPHVSFYTARKILAYKQNVHAMHIAPTHSAKGTRAMQVYMRLKLLFGSMVW